jgi:hypothetical protein
MVIICVYQHWGQMIVVPHTGISMVTDCIRRIVVATINRGDNSGLFVIRNIIFNNISAISWRSVLLVEENGVPGKNHRSATSH